jgi:hypothetical protein
MMDEELKPLCFHSRKQFMEWLALARLVKETCSICEDCTDKFGYKTRMKEENRCHQAFWTHPDRMFRRVVKK